MCITFYVLYIYILARLTRVVYVLLGLSSVYIRGVCFVVVVVVSVSISDTAGTDTPVTSMSSPEELNLPD